jgi:hypothetical protein
LFGAGIKPKFHIAYKMGHGCCLQRPVGGGSVWAEEVQQVCNLICHGRRCKLGGRARARLSNSGWGRYRYYRYRFRYRLYRGWGMYRYYRYRFRYRLHRARVGQSWLRCWFRHGARNLT